MNSLAASAKSDELPFVWVYRFDGSNPPQAAFEFGDISSERPAFRWVHLNLGDSRAMRWVTEQTSLPADARAILTGNDAHQRLFVTDQYVCGIFFDFTRELDHTEDQFAPLRFFVDDRVMITVRTRPLQSATLTRTAIDNGLLRPLSPLELLESLLGNVLEAMRTHTEQLLTDLNDIEDNVLGDEARDDRRRLGPLRRRAVRLHRVVNGAQRIVARLEYSDRAPTHSSAVLHRIGQRLDSLHHDLHAVQERARLLYDEIGSQMTQETNRQLFVLTILGTILMPATLVSGIFGMNVKGLPLTDDESGFAWAIVLCLVASLFALVIVRVIGHGRRG